MKYSDHERSIIDNAMQIIREHMTEYAVDIEFNSPSAVKNYLIMKLHNYEYEVFSCLFLNNQHKLIADEILFRGTIDSASVYPREVVKRALELNAATVIFAHNHPSGIAIASTADDLLTRRLQDALALVEIKTLDHIIVGGVETMSYAEQGKI